MGLMNVMVNGIKKEKREEMMINMMPLMMKDIDINSLMPKMMAAMLKDVTTDDIINYLSDTLSDKEKLKELLDKMKEINFMQKMMVKVYDSKFDFDETVDKLKEDALNAGWVIPEIRNLQKMWIDEGLTDSTKVKILYFCSPQGGYSIFKDNKFKPLSVMMPMGVSVFIDDDGNVKISAWNMDMMKNMFPGVAKEVFTEAANSLAKSLENIIV